jgi:hypothetical protein
MEIEDQLITLLLSPPYLQSSCSTDPELFLTGLGGSNYSSLGLGSEFRAADGSGGDGSSVGLTSSGAAYSSGAALFSETPPSFPGLFAVFDRGQRRGRGRRQHGGLVHDRGSLFLLQCGGRRFFILLGHLVLFGRLVLLRGGR